jgi:hypothetical protein
VEVQLRRRFVIDYENRILLGADYTVREGMYCNHFRWPETGDESFERRE